MPAATSRQLRQTRHGRSAGSGARHSRPAPRSSARVVLPTDGGPTIRMACGTAPRTRAAAAASVPGCARVTHCRATPVTIVPATRRPSWSIAASEPARRPQPKPPPRPGSPAQPFASTPRRRTAGAAAGAVSSLRAAAGAASAVARADNRRRGAGATAGASVVARPDAGPASTTGVTASAARRLVVRRFGPGGPQRPSRRPQRVPLEPRRQPLADDHGGRGWAPRRPAASIGGRASC